MSTIITKVSSVNSFAKDTVFQYNQIVSTAKLVQSQINEMIAFVTDERDNLEKQLINLSDLENTLSRKIISIDHCIDKASSEVDYYSDQYYRADYSDDAAYYRNHLEESKYILRRYKEAYNTATNIQKEADRKKQNLQQLFKKISAMVEVLGNNARQVNKLISLLEDEITFNKKSLSLTINSLENYLSSSAFISFDFSKAHNNPGGNSVIVSNFSGSSFSNNHKKRTTEEYKAKKYRIKSGSFTFNKIESNSIYSVYLPYATQVRNALFDVMKGMHTDFRDAVMKCLGGVVFSRTKNGFNYYNNSHGKMIYIIGVDISSSDFSRLLLMHIGHYLYNIDKSNEKLSLDRLLVKEIAVNINSSNKNIKKLADSFNYNSVGSGVLYHERIRPVLSTSGSAFFSQCFKAYVSQDFEFLNAVKTNFGESYIMFEKIISNLQNI